MCATQIDVQKFIDQGAVVDDCLTHFFGAGFALLPSQRQGSSRPVVLDDDRVIDGQVIRAPVEILQRISTRRHHLGDKLIGFCDGTDRVVHEARLNATPLARERFGLL